MLTPIINLIVALALTVSTVFGGVFVAVTPSIKQVTVISDGAVSTEAPMATEQPMVTEQPTAAAPKTETYQRIAALLSGTKAQSSGEYNTIERGQSGEAVLLLQQRLAELGYYTGTPSGKMDSATQLAFKKFEKANGFTANGVASPEEQEILFSEEAIAAP